MLATQIPSNTWVFDGIWVANSSCWNICILVGFVWINTMDALEQMACGLHLLSASCPSENTFKKKIIWVFRVAKGYSSGIWCLPTWLPTVAEGRRRYFTVLWIEMSSIHNTQYLTVLTVFASIQKFDPSISIWLREGIAIPLNTAKYYTGTRLYYCSTRTSATSNIE